MLDYCLTDEKRKDFVLRYEVMCDGLRIYYADGVVAETDNYEEEKLILENMKMQVIHANDSMELYKKCESDAKDRLGIATTGFTELLLLFSTSGTGLNPLKVILGLINLGYLGFELKEVHELVKCKRIIKDIEKNMMFLENESVINGRDDYMKLVKKVTINDVDGMSLKKVKSMIGEK